MREWEESSDDVEWDKDAQQRFLLKIPYVGKPSFSLSTKMKRLVTKEFDADLRTIYYTEKVGNYFSLKDPILLPILPKVVYQYTCSSDSNVNYIGFTNRSLGERVKEHLRGGTAISDHISSCEDCLKQKITIENFKILKKCQTNVEAMIYEAIFIKRKKPSLNHQLTKPRITFFLAVFN